MSQVEILLKYMCHIC